MRNIVPPPCARIQKHQASQVLSLVGKSLHDLWGTGRIDLGPGRYLTYCRRRYFLNDLHAQPKFEFTPEPSATPRTLDELAEQWRAEHEETMKNGIEAQRQRAVLHRLVKG